MAIEASDVTLVGGHLRGVADAIALSRATMRTIRQNLFWAFAYNAVGIPLAAGLLYPLTGWLLSPRVASAAMSLSSASVVTNSLRLRRFRHPVQGVWNVDVHQIPVVVCGVAAVALVLWYFLGGRDRPAG